MSVQSLTPYLVPFLGLFFGATGFAINIRRLLQARSEVQQNQERAIQELVERLRAVMMAPRVDAGLATAHFIQSTAQALSERYGCGTITVPMMAEAVRAVDLDLQRTCSGLALRSRLEVLNGAMLALDSTLVPLLSIADTDPVAAYYLGQVFLLAVALLALVGLLVLFLTTGSPLMLGLVLIPGAALVYFYLSSVRATRFFRRRGEEAVGERASMRTETRGGMDFFAHMLLSKSQRAYFFWNRLFCSVWETPLMMALTPWGFAGLHNNRFLVARHLRAQIRRLQVRLIRQSLHGLTASSEDLQQLQEIFDRLWVVTGDTKLKQAKEEWRNGPPVA